MVKTSEAIEADVYALIKQSELAKVISGKVYRDGKRPNNSNKEDIIVIFQTAINIFQTAIKEGFYQIGAVNVNVYVPDLLKGSNTYSKNITRCRELGRLCANFVASLQTGAYWFKTTKIIQTYDEPKINQHFININLEFRYNTLID